VFVYVIADGRDKVQLAALTSKLWTLLWHQWL